MAEMSAIRTLTVLRWLAGPLVWAAHFLLVYASESLFCTRGGGGAAHLAVIALATAMGLAVILAATLWNWWRTSMTPASALAGATFMDYAGALLGVLGMLGLLWSALPSAILASCMPPS
jgi:hypothetical protein